MTFRQLVETVLSMFLLAATCFILRPISSHSSISLTGHLSWKYQVRGRWKQEISLVNYQQITVRKADEEFAARNLSYSPLAMRELRQVFVPERAEPASVGPAAGAPGSRPSVGR